MHTIGCVADRCDKPHCRQPAVLRYLGTSLCQKHWDEECLKNSIALDVTEKIVDGLMEELNFEWHWVVNSTGKARGDGRPQNN